MTPESQAAPADRTNWRTAPFNRQAFHQVRGIVPVADIAAGATPGPLPEAPVSLDGFSLALPGGASLDLPGLLAATATDALVILQDGKLVFETYADGMTARTPHILMSGSKSVTGLLAGILQRDGDLDLDTGITHYVPEMEETGYQGATLRNLIDMRAGVTLDVEQAHDYDAAVSSLPGGANFHGLLQSLRDQSTDHGGVFSYVSANTDLVGWAMERATGQSIATLVSERLWAPLGAERDAYVVVDRDGSPWCSGGFCMTARDFARIGALLASDGRRGDVEIVPRAFIDDLCDGGDRAAWRDGEWGQTFGFVSRNMSYRAGWYAIHDAPGLLFAMGIHGQNLFIDRANRTVIAKLSSQASRIDGRAIGLTHMAVAELQRLLPGAAG